MHIVQLYKDYDPVVGGIENHIKALSEGLVRRGHQVTVLVTSRQQRDEISSQEGLTIIKAGRLFHAASTPISLSMLAHARRLKPDIVNLHFPYPPADLAYQAIPGRPPLVVTYHSDIVRQRTMLRVYSPLLRRTLHQASRIIATSPNYIQSSPWLQPHADRCTVVPLGVDGSRFAASSIDTVDALKQRFGTPIVLFVGRLRYYKGLHFLIHALTEFKAHLVLVGTGPQEFQLRTLAHQLGVADCIHFVGDVSDDDLPSFYAAADLYVLPAHLRSEAFGISLLEAQASGLPLVTTELGTGTSFANRHGQTGFVVPPADPHALARAIQVLLAHPELRVRMGQHGRYRASEEFSIDRMVDATEHVYRDVIL